jgi:hypothetical protein
MSCSSSETFGLSLSAAAVVEGAGHWGVRCADLSSKLCNGGVGRQPCLTRFSCLTATCSSKGCGWLGVRGCRIRCGIECGSDAVELFVML